MVRCAAGVEAQPNGSSTAKRESRRRLATQRTVCEPVVVVVLTARPLLQLGHGTHWRTARHIEQLISQAAIEALGVAVLPGTTGAMYSVLTPSFSTTTPDRLRDETLDRCHFVCAWVLHRPRITR